MAICVDPDEHLSTHCLLRPVCLNTYSKYATSMQIHNQEICILPLNPKLAMITISLIFSLPVTNLFSLLSFPSVVLVILFPSAVPVILFFLPAVVLVAALVLAEPVAQALVLLFVRVRVQPVVLGARVQLVIRVRVVSRLQCSE